MNQPKNSAPAFVTAQADENRLKTITKVGELRPMLIEYVDGRGEKSAQVALVSPSGNTVFLISEMIQGDALVKPALPWLVTELKRHLAEKKGVEQV